MSAIPSTSLERIADALERIADALDATGAQERPQAVKNAFTLTSPPLAWFAAQEGPFIGQEATTSTNTVVELVNGQLEQQMSPTSQTTWEWLGITPPARRRRAKAPKNAAIAPTLDGLQSIEQPLENPSAVRARAKGPGRTPGTISRCGRCRREGTRRMNHSNRCRECLHEEWWDE